MTKVVFPENKSRLWRSFGNMLHRTQQEQIEKRLHGCLAHNRSGKGMKGKNKERIFVSLNNILTKDHKNGVRK